MLIPILKSKIHHAVITEANLQYMGSLTLDEDLMDAVQLTEYERVDVVNVNNGERLQTYVIKGARGSGVCCLNGAAARKGMAGDPVIIMSYGLVEAGKAPIWLPITVLVEPGNKVPAGHARRFKGWV